MMSCNSEHMDSNVHFSMGSVVQPRVIAIPCLNPEKASCIPGLIPKLICTHEDGLNFLSVEDRINALDIEATQAPILGPAESQSVIALSAKSALEPKVAKRSFEALCNAVNTELRTIGQSEVQSSMVNTSKVAVPTPVIIARTMVPVVGGVPWNIVSNMPSAENGSSNAGSGVAQLVPLLNAPNFALGNALQLTPCFMPTEVGKPFIDSKLLTTQSVNVPVTPQLILSPAISVDASSAQLSSITMQKKQETVPAVAMQLKPDQVGVEKPDGKTSVSNLRHACTFCSRICAKPSVLEKHLRTHTGERPFPCQSCGLHFKTKSNLYKHCKSRAHQHSLGGPRSETVDSSQEAKLSSVSSSAILSLVGGKLTKESTQHHHRSVEAASDDQHQLSSVTEPLSSCDVSSNVSPARTHIVVTDENSVVHSSDSQTAAASPQRVEKSSQIPLPFVEMQKSAVVAHQSNRTWLEIDKVHIQSNIKECSPPKADLKVMMTEALDDRITRLISQNDTIINTPMAEPPRPKRIIRQSSDFSGQGSAKSLAKPLLRTRSLNPPDKVSADEMDGKLARLSVLRVEDFESKNLPAKGEKAATAPISTDKTLGSRYLTVPGSYPQDSAGSLKQLPLPDNESEFLPDASSSSVRIVLQLCDSVSVSGGSSVPSNPAVTSSSISSTVNSTSLRSSAPDDVPSQVGPPVLPASSSPLPALCIINPYQPASNSGSLSLQYVPQTHISNAVPLQYLVVSSSSAVSAMQTSSKIGTVSSPALVSSSAVVDINCQQPPRRGRPKGSKNRPKLAASSSDPQSRTSLTETTLPVSATDTPSTAGPLWKLKLKNQLLMRRSASNERVFATEQSQENSPNSAAVMSSRLEVDLTVPNKVPASKPIDNLANLKVWSSTPPCPVSVSTEVTETSTVTISRSLSCDASVPLKKRRKTLTELGRGTAFGTRVEDAAVNCESAANELSGCEKADSKDLSGDTLDPSKQSLDQDHFGSRPVSGNVEPLTSSADTTTRSCLPSADVSEPSSGVVEKNLSYPSISIGSNSRSLGVTLHRIVSPVVESGNAAAAQSFASDGVVLGQQVLQLIPSVSTQKSSTCDSAYESTGSSILKSLTGDSGLGSLEGEGDPDVFISEPCSSSASALLTFLGCDRSNSAQSPSKKPIYSTVVNIQSTPTSEVQSYRTWIKSTPNLDRGENDDVEQAAKAPTETSTKRRTDDLSHAAATLGKKKYLEIVSRANYSNCRNEEYKEGTEVAAMSVDGSDNAEKDIKVMEVDTVPPVETAVSVSSIAANKAVIKPKPPLVKMASVYNVGSSVKLSTCDMPSKRTWVCPGGYRSMESYVYVRGRGRGRYVCAICGVRCKKPSILRKHLHSHTDSRPHHCTVCDVGFKTKGNLSKHINSKVHHLRISEQSGQLNSSADSASISERLTGQSDTDSVSQAVVYSPHVSIVQQQQQSIEVESDSRYEFRNNSGCNATIENGPGSSPNPSAQQSSSSQSKEDVDANDSNGLDKHSTADTDAATSLLSMSVCQKSPLGVLEAPAVSPNECVLMTAKVPADPALEGRKKSAEDIFVLTRRGDKLPGSGILSAGFVVRGTTSLLKSTVPGPVAVLAESGTIDGTFDDPAGPTPYPISNDCATIAAASAEPGYDVSHADLELLVAQNLQVPSVTAEQRPSSSERAGRYLNKVSHRLSRLDAVDLSSNSVIDTAVGENPVKGSAKATPEAALTVSSAAANVEEININSSLLALNGVAGARVKPSTTKRCEIYPVPGRVSAEGVRIGTSHACPVCSKPFNNAAQLAIHSNIHYMERPARCAHCRATFASQALLTRHRLAEHPDASSMNGKDNPRPYRCEECGVAFRIQGHLAKHRRSKMHAARMEGLTSEASTLDDENSESNSGEQIQHEIDESLESVDSSVAEQTAALEVQLASTVESCDSPAENGSSVQAIVDATEQLSTTEPSVDPKSDKTKELAPPRSVHTCALCKQTFDVICDFAMHMMSHAEPRHFICEECDAGFTSAQRLAEHKKVHK